MSTKSLSDIIAERDSLRLIKPTIDNAKKYIFEGVIDEGMRLYRIKAIRDIPEKNVNVGDLGGLVQTPLNLSQDGDCWVDEQSRVFGNARVKDNASIENSIIRDNATVGDAVVIDSSTIKDNAAISGNAKIYHSSIGNNVKVKGEAYVSESKLRNDVVVHNCKECVESKICDNVEISGNASIIKSDLNGEVKVTDDAVIVRSVLSDSCAVYDTAAINSSTVRGYAEIYGRAYISDSRILDSSVVAASAIIANGAVIRGTAKISGDAQIISPVEIKDWTIESNKDVTILPPVPVVLFKREEAAETSDVSVLDNDHDYIDRSWSQAYSHDVGHAAIKYAVFIHYYGSVCCIINNTTNEVQAVVRGEHDLRDCARSRVRVDAKKYSPCLCDPTFITVEDWTNKQGLSKLQLQDVKDQLAYKESQLKKKKVTKDNFWFPGAELDTTDPEFIWKYGKAVDKRLEKEHLNLCAKFTSTFSGSINGLPEWLYQQLDVPERDYNLSVGYYMDILKSHIK